jgi:hypothetical protein
VWWLCLGRCWWQQGHRARVVCGSWIQHSPLAGQFWEHTVLPAPLWLVSRSPTLSILQWSPHLNPDGWWGQWQGEVA